MCAGTSRFGLSGYFGLSAPVHLKPAMLRGMPLAAKLVSEILTKGDLSLPSTPELAAFALDAARDWRNAWICLCVG